jgi:hypothetical protein
LCEPLGLEVHVKFRHASPGEDLRAGIVVFGGGSSTDEVA